MLELNDQSIENLTPPFVKTLEQFQELIKSSTKVEEFRQPKVMLIKTVQRNKLKQNRESK